MVLRAGCQLEWVSFPWSSTRERIGLRKLAPRATWTPSCCYLSARLVSLFAFVLLLVGAIGLSSGRLRAATCRRDRSLSSPSCCYSSARSVALLATWTPSCCYSSARSVALLATWTPSCCYSSARSVALLATWTPSCCYLSARSVSLLAFWTPSCCYSVGAIGLLTFS